MKQHFSEADLLETYYTQPGESMPVMMHLADCAECAARYERLERKMRGLAACAHDEKPETFWARQRISIMRKIDAQPRDASIARARASPPRRCSCCVLGGIADVGSIEPRATSRPSRRGRAATSADDSTTRRLDDVRPIPGSPTSWKDYHSMVAWESWVEERRPVMKTSSIAVALLACAVDRRSAAAAARQVVAASGDRAASSS